MTRKKAEVMWPRLIASKILRKRVGSNDFVADFPPAGSEAWSDSPSLENKYYSSGSILDDHDETQTCRVLVSTWNLGGVAPSKDIDIEGWIDTQNDPCDVYIFGFQEVVPLKASSVFGSENRQITMQWNSIIRAALNKKESNEDFKNQNTKEKRCKIADLFAEEKSRDQLGGKAAAAGPKFRCLISKQMVGILISVWIRSDLRSFVRNPSVSCVGCGIMGCLGNKGSVSVRFRLHETSFCFVCSHLASGGKGGDEKQRNSNAAEILSRTTFPRGPSLDLPRNILDHDRVVWLGDLNYRISLPESATRVLIDRGEWNALLKNDQLTTELNGGQIFEGWHEGTIQFAPTYKYLLNSDEYYGYLEGKREKKRAPAWCDRIIWFGEEVKQEVYARGESKLSDHRPVKAIFSTQVRVSRNLKNVQNFFLSERFDDIENKFQMQSSVDFSVNKKANVQGSTQ